MKGEDRDSTKGGLSKAIETEMIYNSTPPHYNVSHQFTYLVGMRDHCDKTLLQMRTNGEVNKKLSKKSEGQLKCLCWCKAQLFV